MYLILTFLQQIIQEMESGDMSKFVKKEQNNAKNRITKKDSNQLTVSFQIEKYIDRILESQIGKERITCLANGIFIDFYKWRVVKISIYPTFLTIKTLTKPQIHKYMEQVYCFIYDFTINIDQSDIRICCPHQYKILEKIQKHECEKWQQHLHALNYRYKTFINFYHNMGLWPLWESQFYMKRNGIMKKYKTKYVVNRFANQENQWAQFIHKELDLLIMLSQNGASNVVKIAGYFGDDRFTQIEQERQQIRFKNNDCKGFILEQVQGQSLASYICQYNQMYKMYRMEKMGKTEKTEKKQKLKLHLIRKKIMRGILEGLSSIHKLNIIHREIITTNIMVTQTGEVYIKGFGFAMIQGCQRLPPIFGAPGYMDPEIAQQYVTNQQLLTTKSDIFGVGAILYLMLAGQNLFEAKQTTSQYNDMIAEKIDFNMRCVTEKSIKCLRQSNLYYKNYEIDFLQGLLQKDPNKRMSADQALSHIYFTHSEEQTHKISLKTPSQTLEQDVPILNSSQELGWNVIWL